jgi:hypothetical protein
MLLTESAIELKKLFGAISLIEKASKNDLKSLDFVENIIKLAGRTPDKRPVYSDGSYHGFGSLHQKPNELAHALIYLSNKDISSFVEIGTSKGSTLAIVTSYLGRFKPIYSVGLDIVAKKNWVKIEAALNVKFHLANSDLFKNKKFDLCFIDGNHSFDWVKRDFENVGRFSKFCMFHDIYDRYCPDVGTYYNKIKGNNSIEFSEFPHDTMGIGILTL